MSDENLQLPDLEIYVEGSDLDAMVLWLQDVFENNEIESQSKNGAKLTCHYNGQPFPIILVKNAGSTGFTSIWFDSRELPWADDMACGKAAFTALGKTVRCIDSVWQSGDDPDRWFEYSSEGEKVINWA
ncbi:hypothetical protein A9Q99_13910 [Gammaproteobacteria bacterium 45_16_T64]|nr:hypothetical protein A9Q99_13910 [Gammaproteobacteria bacterium 45_16_T64]